MSAENRNKATACTCIDFMHVTWLSQVQMQVQKLLKRKKGVRSDVFQNGNELFFKNITSPLKEAHKTQLLLQINLKTNKDDEKNCSSGMPELLLWFFVVEDQLWPHFALVLMSLSLQSSFTGFCDPLLGSKSHLSVARKNKNYPLNPPCKTFSKQQSSLSIQQLNTSSVS